MKRFFLFLLLIPFCTTAQDCNLQKDKDPITSENRISTGFIPLKNASLSIDADSKNVDFFFSLSGDGKCFDYESTVTAFFEGGKLKTNFRNSGTVNCEGYFHFTFRNGTGTPYTLVNLSSKKVITLKFAGTNKTETTLTLTADQQQLLMNLAACLVKEAKTLLQ